MKRLWLFGMFVSGSALAEDFGVHGHTYTIAEPDLLKQITRKLEEMEEEGVLKSYNKRLLKKAERTVQRPAPVRGITRTTQPATRYYDPSITVPYNLKDREGQVFHKAGTRINPLTFRSLSTPLVFIDGDDKAQVAWASQVSKARIILVAGSPFELMERLNKTVYFDQGGTLTQKLGIASVPARVSQEGLLLKIEEIVIPEGSQ